MELLTAFIHELFLNCPYKVVIQCCIYAEINTLLDSIPYVIDMLEPVGYLHASRDPDAVHRDIDSSDQNSNADFQTRSFGLIDEEYRNAIDDDLQEKLHLERPCRYWVNGQSFVQ